MKREYAPKDIAINFTNQCNASCGHCLNSSSSDSEVVLSDEEIKRVFEDCVSLGITDYHLSGGEAFFDFDKLKRVISMGREFDLNCFGIITNAFWATSYETAMEKISELKGVGFNGMMWTSVDVFHKLQSYFSIDKVINFLRANIDSGLKKPGIQTTKYEIEVGTDLLKEATFAMKQAIGIRLEGYDIDPNEYVQFRIADLVRVGRAKNLKIEKKNRFLHTYLKRFDEKIDFSEYLLRSYEIFKQEKEKHLGMYCKSLLYKQDLSIEANGIVKPCYSCVEYDKGINYGNIKEERLPSIVERIRKDPILDVIYGFGLEGLRGLIVAEFPKILDKDYETRCELCTEIYDNEKYMRLIRSKIRKKGINKIEKELKKQLGWYKGKSLLDSS